MAPGTRVEEGEEGSEFIESVFLHVCVSSRSRENGVNWEIRLSIDSDGLK